MKSTKQILIEAREIIADPANWTQDQYALNEYGESVDPNTEEAVCFCALGAICKVIDVPDEGYGEARTVAEFLASFTDEQDVAEFNDGAEHEAVLRLFDTAIGSAS